jgi:hypothetical protein
MHEGEIIGTFSVKSSKEKENKKSSFKKLIYAIDFIIFTSYKRYELGNETIVEKWWQSASLSSSKFKGHVENFLFLNLIEHQTDRAIRTGLPSSWLFGT